MGRILVIEDERSIVSLFCQVLERNGFIVETASSGLEGIERFDEMKFDVVITDMHMPGLDGNAVLQYIRNSKKKNTPVIGISGTPWLLSNQNFDKVLYKPFSIHVLVENVRNLSGSLDSNTEDSKVQKQRHTWDNSDKSNKEYANI